MSENDTRPNAWQPEGNGSPDAPLQTQTKKGPNRGVVAGLSIFIVALVAALVLAIVQPWKKGDSAVAPKGTEQTSGQSSTSSTGTASSSGNASSLPVSEDEARIAQQKKWTAGKDFIPSQDEAGKQVIAKVPKLDDSSGRTLGPATAPVTVRIFSDFSCPMCTKLHNDSMSTLAQQAHAGNIRIEWHNFVVFQQYGSDKAARGALAAAQQGKMWEYIDALYKGMEDPSGHPQYTDESVRAIATNAHLDMAKFDADYSSQAVANTLNEESTLANRLGLKGTPALLIGDSYIAGAYPTKILENTIAMQIELAKK